MKQFIVDTTEPDTLLLETDCPVNEEAIIECITAVWGKAFSLAYVFFLGCCIEMYVFLFLWARYTWNGFAWDLSVIPTLLLSILLGARYVMPKILMKLYFHIRKEHYCVACFYAKSFELHDESERLFVCPYQKMKRVILSERYLILVFPKMLASVPLDRLSDLELNTILENIRRHLWID